MSIQSQNLSSPTPEDVEQSGSQDIQVEVKIRDKAEIKIKLSLETWDAIKPWLIAAFIGLAVSAGVWVKQSQSPALPPAAEMPTQRK